MSQLQLTEDTKSKIRATRQATALRRKSQVVKCYELKIVQKRLNREQKEQLTQLFLEAKWLYNFLLSEKKKQEVYLNCLNPTSYKEVTTLDKDGNKVVHKLTRLRSSYKQTIHMRMISNEKTIRTLFKKGLQKHGSLKFKSEFTCIPLKSIDWKFVSLRTIKLAGISKPVLVRGTKQIPKNCEFANANLVKKVDGYYLKVTCCIDKENFSEPKKNGKEIGLDFGIKTNITTSEGEKINVSIEESERLKRLQRELSRRKKGSNNRFKTIKLLRREYLKLSNRKTDKANKIVHKFKAYDCVAMQDENIAGWHKQFGRQVQHSCMGLIKGKLKMLPQTVVLDRMIPTTKLCSNCGTLNQYLTLEDRVFNCGCGYVEDRDVHAAKNMLAIKNKVFQKFNFVPTEHREITLTEFKAAAEDVSIQSKSRRRSEKIAPFRA